MRRFLFTVAMCLVVAIGVVSGYAVNDYLHMSSENEDLRRVAAEAVEVSRKNGSTADSCMRTLTSCTRIVDACNPQIRDSLLRHETNQVQLAKGRNP